MKSNIVQFAIEQEATPGTAETLVYGDCLVRVREGFAVVPEQELIDLQELQDTSTTTAGVVAAKTVQFNISYILRAPGSTATNPAITDLLNAAMLWGGEMETASIGAVSNGPFLAGERVDFPSAYGYILEDIADGASSMTYLLVTGTVSDAQGVTGEKSQATATLSSAPSGVGYGFRPADWSSGTGYHATCEGLIDGYYWQGRGCLADLQMEFNNGGPCIVTQNFTGALSAQGDKSMYSVHSYPEASVAVPKFLNAQITFDSYNPTGIVSVTLNYPTNPAVIYDANDSSGDGAIYADYNRELPTITMEVDQVATGTYDWFSTLQGGDTKHFSMTHGYNNSGAMWEIVAPHAQVRSIRPGSRDPQRATFEVELGLTGDDNNELFLFQK